MISDGKIISTQSLPEYGLSTGGAFAPFALYRCSGVSSVRASTLNQALDQEIAMVRSDDVNTLPDGLPIPVDDGACSHLKNMVLPALELRATSGPPINLAALEGRTVLYIYPRTGRPDQEPPDGWNEIPGARGCTPQSCSFRDHKAELEGLGAKLFGLSAQDSEYQREAMQRLHLPFALLSDCDFALTEALRLPTFTADGMRLIKRVTLVLKDGQIEHVFYPVFPPDRNAEDVIAWLGDNPAGA